MSFEYEKCLPCHFSSAAGRRPRELCLMCHSADVPPFLIFHWWAVWHLHKLYDSAHIRSWNFPVILLCKLYCSVQWFDCYPDQLHFFI